MTKVESVITVHLTIYKMYPPVLGIFASGLVPTSGYTNGQLIPYIYVAPPADGIYDFDFEAQEPELPSADVISLISATYNWKEYPKDLKGVRIHSKTNTMEAFLNKSATVEVKQ